MAKNGNGGGGRGGGRTATSAGSGRGAPGTGGVSASPRMSAALRRESQVMSRTDLGGGMSVVVRRVGGTRGIDAATYIRRRNIPRDSIVDTPRGRMIVDSQRSSVISGRSQTGNRPMAVDLRNERARVVGVTELRQQLTLGF